jgi:hypothetical protein
MSLFKVWSANLKINIINRFSYDIRIILKQLWISTQHVRRRFHIQIDLNLKKCPPTINQDVIYNPSQSSPNLNHPDFCTCFLYLLLFYIVLTTILFRFCARFRKICEGQNRWHCPVCPFNQSQIVACVLYTGHQNETRLQLKQNLLMTRGHSETAYLRPLLGSETQPWNFLRNPLCNS